MTKVSAIVCFHDQNGFKKNVLTSISHQVNQLIVVSDRGNLTEQRNIGLKEVKKKNEYILFCDGDIIVEKNFVSEAKRILDTKKNIAVVGGRITTPCETPAQELMHLLRHKSFYSKNQPNGCFLVRKLMFDKGVIFGDTPQEDETFYKRIKMLRGEYIKINKKLIHLGEPKTIGELLQRQCNYGLSNKFDWLKIKIFCYFPLAGAIWFSLAYEKYYNIERNKFRSSLKNLSELFSAFMAIYYWNVSAKRIEEKLKRLQWAQNLCHDEN